MTQTSTSIASPVCFKAQVANLLHLVAQFLVRRRILLSAMLFTGLIVEDVVTGVKPHDLVNWRDPVVVGGVLSIVLGVALRSWAVGILRKDAELTMSGPYRLIRNPLYLGSFLMMLGFCVLIDDQENILCIMLPMALIYAIKVRQEEKLLSNRFPAQWADYVRSTPRFIPRLARVNLSATWSAARWVGCREYHALAATIAALIALKAWQMV
jgi:protein-S-isoprenylcysteine O-methyltransferase Ste14